MLSPGPRFTNGFSIAIRIRWKFRFILTSILATWSLQNFVHGTTALLSWHVQNWSWYDGQQWHYSKVKFPSNLNYEQKIVSETGPWRRGWTSCMDLFRREYPRFQTIRWDMAGLVFYGFKTSRIRFFRHAKRTVLEFAKSNSCFIRWHMVIKQNP